jgi:Flp pilus assembly protein TadD
VDHIRLKYRTYGKGLPPRPIRLDIPGWAGDSSKMEDGSVPQPWHCNPFVEGSTYGIELVYPYETECQVINDGGAVRIEWDFARERDAGLSGGEFVRFAPKHYLFNTSLDLQAPPGHVLRLEPHPRFFTDETGTVPIPIIGNLQTEWWPKLFFVAFKAPLPGQRHIFRRGLPYAQIIVVPHRVAYAIERMTPEETAERGALEATLVGAQTYIAEHRWHDHTGQTFNDKYKLLSRIFHMHGAEAVKDAIRTGMQDMTDALPANVTADEALAKAREYHRASRFAESRAICYQLLNRDPANGEALHLLATSAMHARLPLLAVELLDKAVAAHPQSARYWHDLGAAWLSAGRAEEAVSALRRAAQLQPNRADVLSNLAQACALADDRQEAVAAIEQAVALAGPSPMVCFRAGFVYERCGRLDEARRWYEQAIQAKPEFAEARHRLKELDRAT